MGSSGMLSALDVLARVLLLAAVVEVFGVDDDELFRFFAIAMPLPIVDVSRFEKNNLLGAIPPKLLFLSLQNPLLQKPNG